MHVDHRNIYMLHVPRVTVKREVTTRAVTSLLSFPLLPPLLPNLGSRTASEPALLQQPCALPQLPGMASRCLAWRGACQPLTLTAPHLWWPWEIARSG